MSASQPTEITDPALIAQQPQATQAFLAPTAIEWLLVCFANDPQLFAEARTLIASHHFKPGESILQVMYDALCLSTDQYGGATYETVSAIVADMLAQNQSLILTEVQRQILFRRDEYGLIWQVCQPTGVAMEATNRTFSRDLLRRFAHERTVVEPLRRVMNPGFNRGVPENLGDFLRVITTQQARLSTLNVIPEADMTPGVGSALISSSVFRPTGVSFIDVALGGERIGDCCGLIGPTGGGKTTLAIHMAVSNAKQAWMEAQQPGGKQGLVVFVTAEEAAIKLRPRIWSAFFQIPRAKLEVMTDWTALTRAGQLEPYEIAMQQDQQYRLSEIERYEAYSPQLKASFRVLDLSGSDEFPGVGFGSVDEIVSYLSRYTQPIRDVYIDYAGIFCERFMQANNMDEKNYRYLLKTFGDRCRLEIAARFGCSVWVLHQLKGAEGKSKPTKLMHHSDAGESADFANNMALCGCLGVADPYTGCRRLNWSKCRWKAPPEIPPPTLRINDQFAIMEDVSRLFTVGESGQFLSPEDRQQIRGTEGSDRRGPSSGPPGLRSTDTPMNPTQNMDM